MARGFCHTRRSCRADTNAPQRTISPCTTTSHDDSHRIAAPGTTTSHDNSQRTAAPGPDTSQDGPSEIEPSQRKGRKMLCETKLKMPVRGAKVALLPSGDMQFTYVNFKPPYIYTSQLGVILKREYPGVVEEKDQDGLVLRMRAATDWADYFLIEDELGLTSGDRVLSEFWRLFEVKNEDREEADRVLDNYLKKRGLYRELGKQIPAEAQQLLS